MKLTLDSIRKFIQEADELLEKGDLIQASEKYYKAAEEAIKILTIKHNLKVLYKINERKRWSSELLFKAVDELRIIYKDVEKYWLSAWKLHVDGFHEVALNYEEIKRLKEDVKKLISLLK
ncbi:PaREP1 family protein [Sulfurisphaera javensis]|uniref:PaREP1 family protein n=1 Tax=Sulfurisphaera javensis TaxID=2049879 RepID=A0AAT9GN23_9CREN